MASNHKDFLKFAAKILTFLALFLFVDNVLLVHFLVPVIDRYRPSTLDTKEDIVIPQRQIVHLRNLAETAAAEKRIVFIGSSTCVNGIDTDIIARRLQAHGVHLEPVNYGMTLLLAYDLLFLRKELLNPQNRYVVYLYNPFSFSNNLSLGVSEARWSTFELLPVVNREFFRRTSPFLIGRGILGEFSFSIRNAEFLQFFLQMAFNGTLKPATHDYDYPIDEPRPTIRERKYVAPKSSSDLLRSHYLTSDTDESTLGYRAFDRFLSLAHKENSRVIVVAVPEPEFAANGQYRQGVNVSRVDRRAQAIAEKHAVTFIPRSAVADFERDDTLFRDDVHLHTVGREKFSLWIADQIIKIENK